MKKLLFLLSFLLISGVAQAGSFTLTWSRAHDPDFGFNVYFSHNSSPAALIYDATFSPSTRSTVLHNINSDGVYLLAVSAVNKVTDSSGTHLVESNAITMNVLITNGIATILNHPNAPRDIDVAFDPNG